MCFVVVIIRKIKNIINGEGEGSDHFFGPIYFSLSDSPIVKAIGGSGVKNDVELILKSFSM